MCSLCRNPVPNRANWCHLGAIGYDKQVFHGFASCSEGGFACIDCVRSKLPTSFDASEMKTIHNCDLCRKKLKTTDSRSKLHIPRNFEPILNPHSDTILACRYECIGKNLLLPSLNKLFSNSTSRIGCPTCKRTKGKHTLMVLDVVKSGSNGYGEMVLTCKKCLKDDFGWCPAF